MNLHYSVVTYGLRKDGIPVVVHQHWSRKGRKVPPLQISWELLPFRFVDVYDVGHR